MGSFDKTFFLFSSNSQRESMCTFRSFLLLQVPLTGRLGLLTVASPHYFLFFFFRPVAMVLKEKDSTVFLNQPRNFGGERLKYESDPTQP